MTNVNQNQSKLKNDKPKSYKKRGSNRTRVIKIPQGEIKMHYNQNENEHYLDYYFDETKNAQELDEIKYKKMRAIEE